MDRRDFLKTLGRIAALGGLSLLGLKGARAGGWFTKGGAPDGAESCVTDGICSRCAVSNGCGLPQALSFKQASGRT